METIEKARSILEDAGLYVAVNSPSSMLIGSAVADNGEDVQLLRDACGLNRRGKAWIAVFPSQGLLSYEVSGSLQESLDLILAVYSHHRKKGGDFKDAFKDFVKDSDQYLSGRSLAGV